MAFYGEQLEPDGPVYVTLAASGAAEPAVEPTPVLSSEYFDVSEHVGDLDDGVLEQKPADFSLPNPLYGQQLFGASNFISMARNPMFQSPASVAGRNSMASNAGDYFAVAEKQKPTPPRWTSTVSPRTAMVASAFMLLLAVGIVRLRALL